MDYKELGRRIRSRRAYLDMSQGELSAKVGIIQTQLSRVEKGRVTLKVDQLVKIAQALDCSTSYLLGEDQKAA